MQAKLGGASLALAALISVEQIIAETTPAEDLRRLGQFILFMQKNDGSFYSKFIPDQGGRSDVWTSLYYPGEAVLGLLMLYETERDVRWLRGAANGISALARSLAGKNTVEADHWMLLATAKLLSLYNDVERPPVSREVAITHAVQICESILADQPHFPKHCVESGGFALDGRTCPTATRLEGLIAACQFLPDDHQALRKHVGESIRLGIAFLLRAQIPSGQHSGAIPGRFVGFRHVMHLPVARSTKEPLKSALTTFNTHLAQ